MCLPCSISKGMQRREPRPDALGYWTNRSPKTVASGPSDYLVTVTAMK